MKKIYKVVNRQLVNAHFGEIKVKNLGNHWVEIPLERVTSVSYLKDFQIFENQTVNLLKVGMMMNNKYHCFHFVFNENSPVIINGRLCKDFQSLKNKLKEVSK